MENNPIVTITMADGGKIVAELYPDVAPQSVYNFISLIKKGFYNGLIFHRCIYGFMIQGGCPDGTGMGGPGYCIKGEFKANGFNNDLRHSRGVLSMARAQAPDSAGSQFFIMHKDSPHLDGEYAAFGMVIDGMDVVDAIASAPRNMMTNKPKKPQVVANGENAAGNGLLPTHAEDILAAGVDVITLGNHSFGKTQIADFLEESPYILRPANFTGRAPGRGWAVYDCGRVQVGVMNLIGRCNLDFNAENPFTTADRILKSGDKPTFTLVDFHAQATSEKLALSYYLDGRVSALWGTHTHVPTADGRVCPKGMGYLTDLGMTGPAESVLGVRPEQSVEFFLGGLPGRYRMADGPCRLQGALFTLDSSTGLCAGVERIEIQ